MSLLLGLSRQTIVIGSSAACDVHLTHPSVAPIHAEIIHRGGGRLVFIPGGAGISSLKGHQLSANDEVPFDFRSPFFVGDLPLPLHHPAICMMVMSRGYLPCTGNDFIVGRDPERCHLVLSSPGVSSQHATLTFSDSCTLTDHNSTSGTWLEGKRLPPDQPTELKSSAVIAIGPLPLPVELARELNNEFRQSSLSTRSGTTQAMRERNRTQLPGPATAPRSNPTAILAARHRTIMGTIKMAETKSHTIGRTPENDIVLDYAQISSRHATLTCIEREVFLEDAGSELGTFVRGSRLKPGQKSRVEDGARVLFGPMAAQLKLNGDSISIVVEDRAGWAGRPLFDVAAVGISVEVSDRDNPSQKKTLLSDISFKALPGDLIALMGPSGCGKTTLLHALTGYLVPSQGEVRVNDESLATVFESLRGSIGYVPQDDIIHPELTVREAVRYSARFRLPPDYSEEEIERRVSHTLCELGLEAEADLQIGRPEHKILSGGQRKRVNIAMELVTDPVLLFLDEPTSGLAADDTTSLVDLLRRLAHETGKTIVATIHQPAKDEYEKFNLALVLGQGGVQLYFGPTEEAYSFFEVWRGPQEVQGIKTPRDMFAELVEREARMRQLHKDASRQALREFVAQAYNREYRDSSQYFEMNQAERSMGGSIVPPETLPPREQPKGQLRLLLSRYFKIKMRDRMGTAILLLQAPVIGVLLSLVFGATKPTVPYWCLGALNELGATNGRLQVASNKVATQFDPVSDHSGATFFLVVAAIWFGTSNAAREIVSERAIFRRERMVNLGTLNYALSKFLVLSCLCMVQCTVLLSIVFFAIGLSGGIVAFSTSLAILTLTAISSVALGLLLSAVVNSSEAAMALTPIALIPQVVLGGLMVPVTTNPPLRSFMWAMPSRWGFEGVIRSERQAVAQDPGWTIPLPQVSDSLPDFIERGSFQCALAQMHSSRITGAWGFGSTPWLPPAVLLAMTIGLLLLVVIVLRRQTN